MNSAPPSGFAQVVDAPTLARARRGDMQAHELLYRMFGRASYNLALRMLGNPASAEDVVQEVFLKLIAAIRGYRGDAPVGAWLKRLTVNATIDLLRGQRRMDSSDPDLWLDQIAVSQTTPDQAHDALGLLQRLPARARLVVVLHELEGYTHKEMAELFGQTESYSKSILSRALQRLQEWLEPSCEEPELQRCAHHR